MYRTKHIQFVPVLFVRCMPLSIHGEVFDDSFTRFYGEPTLPDLGAMIRVQAMEDYPSDQTEYGNDECNDLASLIGAALAGEFRPSAYGDRFAVGRNPEGSFRLKVDGCHFIVATGELQRLERSLRQAIVFNEDFAAERERPVTFEEFKRMQEIAELEALGEEPQMEMSCDKVNWKESGF